MRFLVHGRKRGRRSILLSLRTNTSTCVLTRRMSRSSRHWRFRSCIVCSCETGIEYRMHSVVDTVCCVWCVLSAMAQACDVAIQMISYLYTTPVPTYLHSPLLEPNIILLSYYTILHLSPYPRKGVMSGSIHASSSGSVTESSTRIYACPQCPKTYARSDYLERHALNRESQPICKPDLFR